LLLEKPVTKKKCRSLPCRRAQAVLVKEFNGVFSENKKGRSTDLYAAVVEFVNSPNVKGWVGGIRRLSAQITFLDVDGNYIHRNLACYWMEREKSEIDLGADVVARHIVAIGGTVWKCSAQNNENEVHPSMLYLELSR
jgi:aspartyl/asparaginyl-tRNA synthetase